MKWSFQLYSARNTPLPEALRLIAAAGYTQVEAYRDNLSEPDVFKRAIEAHGLTVPSMHINIDALRADPAGCQALARAFQCKQVVCPFLNVDERPEDAAGWKTLVQELADMARRWQDAGFTFAWHNHDFEFAALNDGSVAMQHILDGAPELHWEIDAAWIVRANADPIPWVRQYADRICAVHLKDVARGGECEEEDGWADLGYGIVAWDALAPLLRHSGATLYAMEHDNPSDLNRFATRSIAYARTLDL